MRNGYAYGTASAVAEEGSLTTTISSDYDERERLLQEAQTKAAVELTGEVETMMRKLATELPWMQASR